MPLNGFIGIPSPQQERAAKFVSARSLMNHAQGETNKKSIQGDQKSFLGACHIKTTPFVQKNLAGHLKTPKVTRISAMYTNFSHSPVHSGLIYFYRTKNLKLPSGTNKSKWNFYFHQYQPRITLKNCGDQKIFVKILLSNYYIKPVSKR